MTEARRLLKRKDWRAYLMPEERRVVTALLASGENGTKMLLLQRLGEARERGTMLWHTLGEWLLLQRIFGDSSREGELVAALEEELASAAMEAHAYYMDHRQFPNTAHRGGYSDCPHAVCVKRRALAQGEKE